MVKKYIPSGYQIINLEYPNIVSGTPIEKYPETEDEKILFDILVAQSKYTKPILINCKCANVSFSQFAVRIGDIIILGDSSNVISSSVQISYNDGKMYISFIEM